MCLVRARNCASLVRMIAAWLSQWRVVGVTCLCPISEKNVRSHARCCPALLKPMYSDSVVDNATILWCLLAHDIAPRFVMKENPEVDRDESKFPGQSASE